MDSQEMIAWLIKLIGGWFPIGTKPFPEWAGKLIWVIVVIFVYNFTMGKLFPPKPTTINVAGNYIAEGKGDVAHFGCSLFRGYGKVGITK
jgi:hypothetical protein